MVVTITAACERTPCFSSELIQTQFEFFQDDLFTDLEIKVDGGSISCHRLVVAAHSSVIKAMLTSGMKEALSNTVSLPSISKAVMTEVIRFMYTGQVEMDSEDMLLHTLAACDYLDLSTFKTPLLKCVISTVSVDNVFHMLAFATEYNIPLLLDACHRVMYLSFEDVVKDEAFLAIGKEDMIDYLSKYNDYDIPADAVLQAFISWLERNPMHYDIKLDFIDLSKCSSSVLNECLDFCQDKFLTAKNLLTVLKTACSAEKKQVVNALACVYGQGIITTTGEQKFYKIHNSAFHLRYKATIPQGFLLKRFPCLCVYDTSTMELKELPQSRRSLLEGGIVSYRNGLAFCEGTKIGYWNNIYDDSYSAGPSFPDQDFHFVKCLVSVRDELFLKCTDDGKLYVVKDNELISTSSIPGGAKIVKIIAVYDWILVIAKVKRRQCVMYWYSPKFDVWSKIFVPSDFSIGTHTGSVDVANRKLYIRKGKYYSAHCLTTLQSKMARMRLPVSEHEEVKIVSLQVCKDLYEEKRKDAAVTSYDSESENEDNADSESGSDTLSVLLGM